MQEGITAFGRIPSEIAILARPLVEDLRVIAEIRPQNSTSKSELDIVILIKNKVSNFESLKDQRYCHPGFGKVNVNRRMLNEFENKVLNITHYNMCSDKDTLNSQYISGLENFFGDSCRPGAWVENRTIDMELKKRYSRLCKICSEGTNEDKCSTENINNPFEESINCLLRNGDIAVTTTKNVQDNYDKLKQYYYLCPKGYSIPIRDNDTCTWSQKPWDLLVAYRKQANNVKEEIEKVLNDKDSYSEYLKQIILEKGEIVHFLDSIETLKTYVTELDTLSDDDRMCKKTLSWCTISNEETEKCRWLAQAAINEDIYPGVECKQKGSPLECLESIKNNEIDVFNIYNRHAYAAKRKMLQPIAFAESSERDLTKTLIVLRNSTKITSLSELENKVGCFAEFGAICDPPYLKNYSDYFLTELVIAK